MTSLNDTPDLNTQSALPYSWHKGHKYYNIHIQPNLFGGASLIKTWGAKGSKRGGCKVVYCDSEEEASVAITATAKRRKLRGYRPYDAGYNKTKTPSKELLELVAVLKRNNSFRCLTQLIEPHSDINAQDRDGYTALHWAAHFRNINIVAALINSGAEIDIRCDKGCTPLMAASWRGQVEIVKMLIKYGSSVNIRSDKSHAALTMAILGQHTEIVRLLLKCGAEVTVKDKGGQTMQEYALDSKSLEIIELIKKQYAKVGANLEKTAKIDLPDTFKIEV